MFSFVEFQILKHVRAPSHVDDRHEVLRRERVRNVAKHQRRRLGLRAGPARTAEVTTARRPPEVATFFNGARRI